jgi:AmmeMemoRadiSam system protein A
MILAAFVFPHPPIILPEIGKGREKEAQSTIDAFDECAKTIARLKPDTIFVCSPHFTSKNEPLDHGVTVPLHFVDKYYPDYSLMATGVAGYSLQENYDFGKEISAELTDKRVIFIASGDLSHALSENAPCGFAKEGEMLDKQITDSLADGDFERIMNISSEFAEKGKECGLRPIAMMAGLLYGLNVTPRLHSYEGTFGVGYAVASFIVQESEYVQLARYSLESYVKTGKIAELPVHISAELTENKAGVFVCIKSHGNLRGCIGTILPVTENIAQEILRNAVSAACEDPRFPPVKESELDDLVYTVDVLAPPEPISSAELLDVKLYGVIVTSGRKRGLLLPNLDGVDTVDEQIAIAKQKAGIHEGEPVQLERFEVKRYE